MSVSLLKLYSDHLHVSMLRAEKIEGAIWKGNSIYRNTALSIVSFSLFPFLSLSNQ